MKRSKILFSWSPVVLFAFALISFCTAYYTLFHQRWCLRSCTGHGYCSLRINCVCSEGWIGEDCSFRNYTDEEIFTPCLNDCSGNGECVPYIGEHSDRRICKCNHGWTGPDCALKTCYFDDLACGVPSFVIIGVQKGGTTSIHNYLSVHPQVMYVHKMHFFDEQLRRGGVWYFTHFRSPQSSKIAGEGSPKYLLHYPTPRMMHAVAPWTKLIVLLRNPVERAWSAYNMNERKVVPLKKGTFDFRLRNEWDLLQGCGFPDWDTCNGTIFHAKMLSRGFYYHQLKHWLKYFSLEQFHVIKSEDMFEDPQTVLDGVHRFLGIYAFKYPNQTIGVSHNSGGDYNPPPADTREWLEELYRPWNKQLEVLVNRTFNWF